MKTLNKILAAGSLVAFTLTANPSCQSTKNLNTNLSCQSIKISLKEEAVTHYVQLGEYRCRFDVKSLKAKLVNENNEVVAERDPDETFGLYHWVREGGDCRSYTEISSPKLRTFSPWMGLEFWYPKNLPIKAGV
jgi:hypothetical protein